MIRRSTLAAVLIVALLAPSAVGAALTAETVYIADVSYSPTDPEVGETVTFEVEVTNDGTELFQIDTLRLERREDDSTLASVTDLGAVPEGVTKTIPVTYEFSEAGTHVVTLRVLGSVGALGINRQESVAVT
ncbi:MAG: hypothetical protein ABEI99_12975, partial [Halobaculum sp.]